MSSVTGSVISSDSARSAPRWASLPAPTDTSPVSAMRSPGCAALAALATPSSGASLSLPPTGSPRRVTTTSTASRWADSTGAAACDTCGRAPILAATSRPAVSAAAGSSRPDRAVISTG
jgi:hypothetical protein